MPLPRLSLAGLALSSWFWSRAMGLRSVWVTSMLVTAPLAALHQVAWLVRGGALRRRVRRAARHPSAGLDPPPGG